MTASHRDSVHRPAAVPIALVLTLLAWSAVEVTAQVPPAPPPPAPPRPAARATGAAVGVPDAPVAPARVSARATPSQDGIPPQLPVPGGPGGFPSPVPRSPDDRGGLLEGGHDPYHDAFAEHEARAAEAARAFRELSASADSAQREELRAQVRVEVNAAFEARQEAQRRSLEALRARLEAVERTLAAREEARERIVEHRVDVLLDPTLAWPESASVPQPGSPYGAGAFAPGSGAVRAGGYPTAPATASSRARRSARAEPDTGAAPPGLPGFDAAGGPGVAPPVATFGGTVGGNDDPLAALERVYGTYQDLEGAGAILPRSDPNLRNYASRLKALHADLETRKQLVMLDLRKAELELESAHGAMEIAKRRHEAGQETEDGYHTRRAEVELARIELERARTILDRHVQVAREIEDALERAQKREPAGAGAPPTRTGGSGRAESSN